MGLNIGVVGSVELDEKQLATAEHLIDAILSRFIGWAKITVISGGAEGIDTLAVEIAESLNIPTKIFWPLNQHWAPDGFKDRNIKIAETSDILYAIRSLTSQTYGSGWTADYADKLEKEVYRIYI